MAERAPEATPNTRITPLVAIGGLLTVKRVAFWYNSLLEDEFTDLPPAKRFVAPPDRGIGEPEEILKRTIDHLEKVFDRLDRRRMFLSGHSLGGLLATMAAVERPDLVGGVVSLGGAHAGYSRETPATLALRHGLGNPKEAEHLRHDSPFMQEHQEKMASEWPADVPLHIISSPSDVLVVPPHGFDVALPAGRQPDKRLVVPPLRAAEWAIRRGFKIPDDVKPIRTWHPTEHVNLPRVPAIINHVHESRLALAGLTANIEEAPFTTPALLPAAA